MLGLEWDNGNVIYQLVGMSRAANISTCVDIFLSTLVFVSVVYSLITFSFSSSSFLLSFSFVRDKRCSSISTGLSVVTYSKSSSTSTRQERLVGWKVGFGTRETSFIVVSTFSTASQVLCAFPSKCYPIRCCSPTPLKQEDVEGSEVDSWNWG